MGWRLALAAGLLCAATVHAQSPRSGGTLQFAVTAEPVTYDCHASGSFALIHPLRPHYSTLLKFDAARYPAIKGDLAESWTVSPDGLTYTFRLRRGVVFHDGTPLTAEDVKASYERIRRPPPGVRSVREAMHADISAIEASDPQTVVFTLSRPNSAMLANFASPWNCIYSAAKLQADPRFPEKNVLGTGPYVFEEHVPRSRWRARRFARYYEPGKPYLDGYVAHFMPPSRAADALVQREIQAEFRGFGPAERDRIVTALGKDAVVHESPWLCNLVLTFNTEKAPFADRRVRRALSLALDRWGGAQTLAATTTVRHVGGLLRPGHELAANERELLQWPGFSRDIEASRNEARRLLKEAGVPALNLTLMNRDVQQPYAAVGGWLIDQWRLVGVTARHEVLETRRYLAALQAEKPTFDAALDFGCDFADEPNFQLQKYLSYDRSPMSHAHHTDRRLDQYFDRQSGETDRRKRAALLRSFEKRALEQAYTVPTIWWHRTVVMHRDVRGWHMTPSHYVGQDLADVWLAQ